jgi:hypothetical protein
MSFEYICKAYDVPACYGRLVIANGDSGIITGTH